VERGTPRGQPSPGCQESKEAGQAGSGRGRGALTNASKPMALRKGQDSLPLYTGLKGVPVTSSPACTSSTGPARARASPGSGCGRSPRQQRAKSVSLLRVILQIWLLVSLGMTAAVDVVHVEEGEGEGQAARARGLYAGVSGGRNPGQELAVPPQRIAADGGDRGQVILHDVSDGARRRDRVHRGAIRDLPGAPGQEAVHGDVVEGSGVDICAP